MCDGLLSLPPSSGTKHLVRHLLVRSRIGSLLKARVPARGEIISVLGVVVFAVHSWSVREFLFHLPSLILKLPTGELLAIFCYHLAVAFIESATVTGLLVLLAALLPPSWLRNGFVHKGFLIALSAGVAAILLQHSFFYAGFAFEAPNTGALYERVALGLLLFMGSWMLVQSSAGLQWGIRSFVDRLSVMLLVYLPLDVIGLVVVTVRLIT